jgi:hypothetical protein
MRKANAIIEYSVLIFIIIAAIAGLQYTVKRHFQSFVKEQTDSQLRQPVPLLWQSSVTFSNQKFSQDRDEYVGGDTVIVSDAQTSFTTLSAPPPSVQGVSAPGAAGLHVQDAALPPPQQNNPDNSRNQHEQTAEPQ